MSAEPSQPSLWKLLWDRSSIRSASFKRSGRSRSRRLVSEMLYEEKTNATQSIRETSLLNEPNNSKPVDYRRRRSTNLAFGRVCDKLQPDPRPELDANPIEEFGFLHCDFKSLRDAKESRSNNKPIFLMESQVPGDIWFGREVLRHPLVIEAIETLFCTVGVISREPVARTASGRICCTRIHFLSRRDKSDLVPSITGESLTQEKLIQSMIAVLEKSQVTVPRYLKLLLSEAPGHDQEDCFDPCVTGGPCCNAIVSGSDLCRLEDILGGLDGILATKLEQLPNGERVIRVCFKRRMVSYSTMIRKVLSFATRIYYTSNDEKMAATIEIERLKHHITPPELTEFSGHTVELSPECDHKHALRKTHLRYVPMTALQATQANHLVATGRFNEVVKLLSPRQNVMFSRAMKPDTSNNEKYHDVVDVPILLAWKCFHEKIHPRQIEKTAEYSGDDDEEEGELIVAASW